MLAATRFLRHLSTIVLVAVCATASAAPGDLDPSFGGLGIVGSALGTGADSLAIQPDDKLIVIGADSSPGVPGTSRAIVRYNSDGSIDRSFGTNGIVIPEAAHRTLLLQQDGRILTAGVGYITSQLESYFQILRYSANGTYETVFGQIAVQALDFFPAPALNAIAMQNDGKVLVAGASSPMSGPASFTIARFREGAADVSFGTAGLVRTDVDGVANALVVQQDGKIVAAGCAGHDAVTGSPRDFTLIRYTGDGSLDTSLGGTGIVRVAVGAFGSCANGLALQQDGKIVAAGYSVERSDGARSVALARFNADGSVDATFGNGGVIRVPSNAGSTQANAVALQGDGRLIVTGTNFFLRRYNVDGSADATFAVNGGTSSVVAGGEANALAIDGAGKAVASGIAADANNNPMVVLTRTLTGHGDNAIAGTLIEYVNTESFPTSPGGHYFYTLEGSAEAAIVDSGAAGPFMRTGGSWRVGGTSGVARFYGSVTPGPNSHFYSLSAVEIEQLRALQVIPTPSSAQQWNYEGIAFAATPAVLQPDGTAQCPGGRTPIYRAYNNAWYAGVKRAWDSNHRYSDDPSVISFMESQYGWTGEGIAYCAP